MHLSEKLAHLPQSANVCPSDHRPKAAKRECKDIVLHKISQIFHYQFILNPISRPAPPQKSPVLSLPSGASAQTHRHQCQLHFGRRKACANDPPRQMPPPPQMQPTPSPGRRKAPATDLTGTEPAPGATAKPAPTETPTAPKACSSKSPSPNPNTLKARPSKSP